MENKRAARLLKELSNNKTSEEYKINLKNVKEYVNDDFYSYFQGHLKMKEKWVFCFLSSENKQVRTNTHIESWHKTLKYSYLDGKKIKVRIF